jgi:hypothetical protein
MIPFFKENKINKVKQNFMIVLISFTKKNLLEVIFEKLV